MATNVLDPSDIAPEGFVPNDDPDPMGAFAPSTVPLEEPAAEPVSIFGTEDQPPADPEEPPPEPPEPRPEVRYVGGEHDVTTVRLRTAIVVDGVKIASVRVNPPALWDVQDFLAQRIKTNIEMASRMTGIAPVVLGALRWPDAEAIFDVVLKKLPDFIRESIK